MIFNIPTGDDDDGNASTYDSRIEYITEQQEADIIALAEEVKADKSAFLAILKITEFGQIKEEHYSEAIRLLEKKRKANAS